MGAAEELRSIRKELRITTRQVQEFAKIIARDRQNEEFYISNAWLTQLENYSAIPSIHKLYSLSVIYRRPLSELLRLFGVEIGEEVVALNPPEERRRSAERADQQSNALFANSHDQDTALENTNLVTNLIRLWGCVPWPIFSYLDVRHGQFGFVGTTDYTMFPIIRPGSFVRIDSSMAAPHAAEWHKDTDRPIYFVELRERYICSWCDLQGSELTVIPHPLSGCAVERFAFPADAEIVGQVVAVAMELIPTAIAPEPTAFDRDSE